MASKAMQWAATIALGLTLMGSAKGVDDSQTINITRDNKTPEAVEGKMGSADNPISRELKINTEGVIDKTPVITTDRGPGWVIKEGGKGYPNVTVGNTPKENGSAMAPGPYHLDVKGVSRLIGGEGTGNPTYEWTASEEYRMVKAYIVEVPDFLYANASLLVPVTVVFEGLPPLNYRNIKRPSGNKYELVFKDDKGQEHELSIDTLRMTCDNGSYMPFSPIWGDIEIEPGKNRDKVTFWMQPESYRGQYKNLVNPKGEKGKWELSIKIDYNTSFQAYSDGTRGKTEYLFSPEIPVVEITKGKIKILTKSYYDYDATNDFVSKGHFKILASDGDYASIKYNDKKLELGKEYEWEGSNSRDVLHELGFEGAECSAFATKYSHGISSYAKIEDTFGWSNDETVMIVSGEAMNTVTFGISYPMISTMHGKQGMDLRRNRATLRFPEMKVPVDTMFLLAQYGGVGAEIGTIVAGATAGVLAAAIAPLAIAPLTAVVASAGITAIIENIAKDVSSQVAQKLLTEALASPSEKQKDAFSDVSASIVAREVYETIDSASTLFQCELKNDSNGKGYLDMNHNYAVNVGSNVMIEAGCVSRVCATTHIWRDARAESQFSKTNMADVLKNFRLE